MIDVMKRLAELDSNNSNVVKAESKKQEFNGTNAVTVLNNYTGETVVTEQISIAELQKLSGLNEGLAECGPMGMMSSPSPMGMQKPSASFSLNASAASGDEVASMLTQIMNLAGVKDAGHHLGTPDALGGQALTAEPAGQMGHQEPMSDIAKALGHIDGIEDEEAEMGAGSAEFGDEPADFSGQLGHDVDDKSPTGDVGDMVNDVEDMTNQLKDKDPEDFVKAEDSRIFDNSPKEHTRAYDPNSFADVINRLRDFDNKPYGSGDNPMKAHATEAVESTDDTGSLAEKLMSDYQQFINEGNQKVDKISEMSPGKYAAVHKRAVARGNDASQSGDEDEADRQYAKASVASHLGNERRKSAQMKKGVNPNH